MCSKRTYTTFTKTAETHLHAGSSVGLLLETAGKDARIAVQQKVRVSAIEFQL